MELPKERREKIERLRIQLPFLNNYQKESNNPELQKHCHYILKLFEKASEEGTDIKLPDDKIDLLISSVERLREYTEMKNSKNVIQPKEEKVDVEDNLNQQPTISEETSTTTITTSLTEERKIENKQTITSEATSIIEEKKVKDKEASLIEVPAVDHHKAKRREKELKRLHENIVKEPLQSRRSVKRSSRYQDFVESEEKIKRRSSGLSRFESSSSTDTKLDISHEKEKNESFTTSTPTSISVKRKSDTQVASVEKKKTMDVIDKNPPLKITKLNNQRVTLSSQKLMVPLKSPESTDSSVSKKEEPFKLKKLSLTSIKEKETPENNNRRSNRRTMTNDKSYKDLSNELSEEDDDIDDEDWHDQNKKVKKAKIDISDKEEEKDESSDGDFEIEEDKVIRNDIENMTYAVVRRGCILQCLISECYYQTMIKFDFINHLIQNHLTIKWSGRCRKCRLQVFKKPDLTKEDEFWHMMEKHIYKENQNSKDLPDIVELPETKNESSISKSKAVEKSMLIQKIVIRNRSKTVDARLFKKAESKPKEMSLSPPLPAVPKISVKSPNQLFPPPSKMSETPPPPEPSDSIKYSFTTKLKVVNPTKVTPSSVKTSPPQNDTSIKLKSISFSNFQQQKKKVLEESKNIRGKNEAVESQKQLTATKPIIGKKISISGLKDLKFRIPKTNVAVDDKSDKSMIVAEPKPFPQSKKMLKEEKIEVPITEMVKIPNLKITESANLPKKKKIIKTSLDGLKSINKHGINACPWLPRIVKKWPSPIIPQSVLVAKFKCMDQQCSFTTQNANNFKMHLDNHVEKSSVVSANYLSCSYCDTTEASPIDLIRHICDSHKYDNFQCKFCFYRSCANFNVLTHQKNFHRFVPPTIIKIDNSNKRNYDIEIEKIKKDIKKYVRALMCVTCMSRGVTGKKFYVLSDYLNHLKEHERNNEIIKAKCKKCSKLVDNAESLYSHVFNCFENIAYYQCVYCSFGGQTKDIMHTHLSNLHPSKMSLVYARTDSQPISVNAHPGEIECASIQFISLNVDEEFVTTLSKAEKPKNNNNSSNNQSNLLIRDVYSLSTS